MSENAGLSRRRFLGRSAIVGGALVWAVPVVEVLDRHRAFAASGSGGVTPPPTTKPPVSPSTPVLGTSTSRPAAGPTGGAGGGSGGGVAAGSGGSGGLGTRVLGQSTAASSSLPFTGSNLPVKAALEAGAGLVAGGVVLRALGARASGAAGGHTASRPDVPGAQD